jgi:hypothetical protein
MNSIHKLYETRYLPCGAAAFSPSHHSFIIFCLSLLDNSSAYYITIISASANRKSMSDLIISLVENVKLKAHGLGYAVLFN